MAASVTYDNTALTRRKGRWIILSAQTVFWSIIYHMFSLTYFSQKHEFKVFMFLLDETEMAQNNTFCLENFKLQSCKMKLEKWHESSNKSEITGFYPGKNSKISGSFTWGCFMWHRLGFFDVAFDPHISSIVHFVVDRVARLALFVSVAEADDSPAPTLRSSLLSPLLPLPLILENSLPNSCVTDGNWFSSISHFAIFTKSVSNYTIFFNAFSLFIILE